METSAQVIKGWRILRSQFLHNMALNCLLQDLIFSLSPSFFLPMAEILLLLSSERLQPYSRINAQSRQQSIGKTHANLTTDQTSSLSLASSALYIYQYCYIHKFREGERGEERMVFGLSEDIWKGAEQVSTAFLFLFEKILRKCIIKIIPFPFDFTLIFGINR